MKNILIILAALLGIGAFGQTNIPTRQMLADTNGVVKWPTNITSITIGGRTYTNLLGFGLSLTNGQLSVDTTQLPSGGGGGGSGTVTSVGLSTSLSGLTVGSSPVTSSGTITLSGTLGLGSGGTGATDAPGARTALSLVPGTDVQAYDADLTAMAAGTAVATAQTNAVSMGAPVLYVGSTNIAEAIALKASLTSPALNGDPTAPTASAGDSDESIATTAFVYGRQIGFDVRRAGAAGNGITDDTTALRNAHTNASVIYPPGTYLVSGTIYPTNGVVAGFGMTSKIIATNFAGMTFDTGQNIVQFRDLMLDGIRTNTISVITNGNRGGIRLYAGGQSSIRGVIANNFSGPAVVVSGETTTSPRRNQASIIGLYATNNWVGVWMEGTNRAEYCSIGASVIRENYIGVWNDSANVTISGNDLTDNTVGYFAMPGNGRSHSLISGCTLNHTTIVVSNATTGVNFSGNNILGGTDITFGAGTVEAFFSGNYFESGTAIADNTTSGLNVFHGNKWLSGASSYSGSNRPRMINNRSGSGAFYAYAWVENDAATVTFDLGRASLFAVTVAGNRTLAVSGGADGQSVQLEIIQNATGGFRPTLSSGSILYPTNIIALADLWNTNAAARTILTGTYSARAGKLLITGGYSGY